MVAIAISRTFLEEARFIFQFMLKEQSSALEICTFHREMVSCESIEVTTLD
jgi:hypothetical protein